MVIIFQKNSGQLNRLKPAHVKTIADQFPEHTVKALEVSSPNFNKELLKADVLISPSINEVDPEAGKNLKWVHVTSAGVNAVPDWVMNSDILLTNSSGVHPVPISEHVFGLMLMLSRGLHTSFRNQITKKQWIRDTEEYVFGELYGKTLLIVGMGQIGERIARLGKAFEMEVFGIVRNPKGRKEVVPVFGMDELEKLAGTADVIVNALPLTDETKGLFDKKFFEKCKKDSLFINIGRGESANESDLIEALQSGKLAGAGLDVFEKEPLPDNSPLWNMENVIITPHYSGWTPVYMDRVVNIFAENLKAYLAKKPMPNLVDKKLGY